jgi:ATP-dependent Zn protease
MNIEHLRDERVLPANVADVGVTREHSRQRRLYGLLLVGAVIGVWLWVSVLVRHLLGTPHLTHGEAQILPLVALVILIGAVMVVPLLAAGRSPHVRYRPEEIDVSLDDVKGIPVVVEEAVRTLNLFLAHATFRSQMGGTPRKAILFDGPPGTGKTHLAKALAREAGVPFFFVSSSAFQSMFYGQTNRKIRSYFAQLRKAARREGGAIGFIEEIDAIGATRMGMGQGGGREGIAGVVNELLIQLQSFDQPSWGLRWWGGVVEVVNRLLPADRPMRKPHGPAANVLVIGATNRAADLDPALLRPGRFDRTLTFELPSRTGRKDILDHELVRRSHEPVVGERTDQLAAQTFGYSPAMLVHLLDESLVWALRRGATQMSWEDVQHAKLTEEVGLAQPVEYTEAERRTIATHEAGHATVAWLVGRSRKLEVLSIIKRNAALGLLAHSEIEERFTQTESELQALIQISLGGMVTEELFFGERSSGVASDLKSATTLAAQMVGALGMGDTLISYEALQAAGPANLTAKVLASDEGRDAVARLLEGARVEVVGFIEANRHVVEGLRDALLARDELVGDEIMAVIEEAVAQPV